jgi:hypothetical protein
MTLSNEYQQIHRMNNSLSVGKARQEIEAMAVWQRQPGLWPLTDQQRQDLRLIRMEIDALLDEVAEKKRRAA